MQPNQFSKGAQMTGSKLKYSYFQLTFGQEETYLHPEMSYKRLRKYGYDAIEITPPKGRYGLGVKMEHYLETHKRLKDDFEMGVSCINECWGEKWDPFSPNFKTLTEKKTADLAVSETLTSIDFAVEIGAPFVTVAVAIHDDIRPDQVKECTWVAVDALQRMSDHAKRKNVQLVFEATNHLEMGKFVNTAANHKRLIELTKRDNIGIQLDWFHANFEELNPYEAVMDAHPLLWHMHFRDSNSLTPGFGNIDFKAVLRAVKKIGYTGYCTIEIAPMIPDPDTAVKVGIEYLRLLEGIVDYQLSPEFPNGYAVKM